MTKFIVEPNLDCFDTDAEAIAACKEFIEDALSSSAGSITVRALTDEEVRYQEFNDVLRTKLADKEHRLLLVLRQRELLVKKLYETAKELERMNEKQFKEFLTNHS